ncbi:MAG: hypothetical protein H6759_04940 [Candidatus Nomurabacteria bacterium]|nr:MAG: hypothetical protein H6759_04940 [Candidatus Nomurabacteria bacterium]
MTNPQDQRLFPFGRETLYLLYSDTHSRTSIDDLLSKAHRQGDIILYRNAIQGEAIKFWPSPASPVLATTEHKPSADSALFLSGKVNASF